MFIKFLMSSSNPTTLQQLRRLDRSPPNFHDQLSNVFDGEEYERSVPNIQGHDLVSLVDYLDEVWRPYHLLTLCLSERRLSIFSILQAPVSVNVYTSLETCVAPE